MKIKLEIHEDSVDVIKKILNSEERDIELEIPEGSVLFENSLNLKLVQKEAERNGKDLVFNTSDEVGRNLINSLNRESSAPPGDFSAKEILEGLGDEEEIGSVSRERSSRMPVTLPVFNFDWFKLHKINWKPVLIVLILAALLGGAYYYFEVRSSEAEIKVVLASQPLTKSIEIKVVSGQQTDPEKRILSGNALEVSVEETATTETTGEKQVGEKAKGVIKIYNKTDSSKKFDKGEELIYEDDGDEFKYILDDDIEVPARTDEDPDPTDPTAPPQIIPGEAEADVLADEFGEYYNLDSGKNLEFKDYKTTDYIATVTKKISGGSSETIKIVAEEDPDTVSAELETVLQDKAKEQLGLVSTSDKKRIAGSETYGTPVLDYSAEVGDEAEELTLKETLTATSLTYSQDDLEKMIDELLKEFVPENFELFTEETELNVEVLGNSDSTVLSSTEADLQVTVKAFIVPEIDDEDLKKQLSGKSPKEAERILGSVRNIQNYEVQSTGGIPIIGNRLPSNPENITLKIEKE